MAAPHKAKLNTVEFSSARQKVMSPDPNWIRATHYDNLDQTPLTNRDGPLVGSTWMEPRFSLQVAGSGTAGTAPAWGTLLLACGMSGPILVPDTSAKYTADCALTHTGLQLDLYLGNGLRQRSASTIGTGRFTMRPNEPCIFEFEGSGLYTAPSEASGSASLATKAQPVICKALEVELDGFAGHFKELTFDLGLVHNGPWEDISDEATEGCRAPVAIDQVVTAEGLIVIPALSSLSLWVDMLANAAHTIEAVLGSAAGNIATFDMTGYPTAPPEIVEADGVYCARVRYRAGSGSGEPLEITFT